MVGYSDMEHCEEDSRLRSPHCHRLRVCTDVYPGRYVRPQAWYDYGIG